MKRKRKLFITAPFVNHRNFNVASLVYWQLRYNQLCIKFNSCRCVRAGEVNEQSIFFVHSLYLSPHRLHIFAVFGYARSNTSSIVQIIKI